MSPSFVDQEPPFLDIDQALEHIGGEQAMDDLLVLLEESLARDIPLIAEYLSQGDVQGANRVLHAMKGVVPIFCTDVLCDQVAQVEGPSKAGEATAMAGVYARLRPNLERLLAEVTEYLGDDLVD